MSDLLDCMLLLKEKYAGSLDKNEVIKMCAILVITWSDTAYVLKSPR